MVKLLVFTFTVLLALTFAHEEEQNKFLTVQQHYLNLTSSGGDELKSFIILCKSKGYPVETHKILTEDGYWLTVFRIPGRKGQSREEAKAEHKPVIFLQHGIVDSSDTFILNDEEKAPGFMLANAGYDVWLGNSRGSKHSREHQWLDPDDPNDQVAFWDYSFEEMAEYDVKANVEYILKTTGKSKLAIAAHSQGTTQMIYTMTNNNEWWNEKVSIFVCLAGVARLENCGSSTLQLLAKEDFVMNTIKALGIYEMFPSKYYQNVVFSVICKNIPSICDFFLEVLSDDDAKVNNQNRIGVFLGHYPAGSSLKCFDHFRQILLAKQFQRYDYGEEMNMKKYGQKTPPAIDISKVRGTKIVQIAGSLDLLADPTDNKWLSDQFGDNLIYFKYYELGHMGFLLADDMQFMHDVLVQLKQNPW
eukprot:CAMPEP_0168331882 /NCGR_PEP_ID=MMETSP0213-20121227/8607_1 /TAXON_ID=151035 /ORGANISM="Euplotes harpa, Strain FSP1.4" /LENGTH=416 /DNA_ID=CAMNT_0008335761 /DNA_START=16 /DNA_END=1263 /DNA_ORIENTATION=-